MNYPTHNFRSVSRIGLDLELKRQFAQLEPGIVLDIGSKASPYRDLIPHTRYMRIDIDPRSKPDICGDVHEIDWEDNYFDTVIATEVFEHLYDPQKAINELRRVLKPGGVCISSTPFIYQYHADPYDYYRYTNVGLEHLFSAFDTVELTHHGGRLQAVWQLCAHGNLKPFLRPFNPLIARLRPKKTKAPLGWVARATK